MPDKNYRKLPGRKINLIGYNRLYEASDHILSVNCIGASERYKRFYFKDIQAIISHKTHGGKIRNALAIVFILFFGGMGLAIGEMEAYWIFGIAAGLFVVYLVISIVRGPSCKTHILTAIQTEELPSLHQWRNARRVMDRLKPIIESNQGTVDISAFEGRSVERVQMTGGRQDSPAESK